MRLAHVHCGDIHPVPCYCAAELAINVGDACVIELDKILEFGHVTSLTKIDGEAEKVPQGAALMLRRATLQDQSRANENILFSKTARHLCQEKIQHHQLNMRLLRVHYTFDRSRLQIVFTAESRVDFRQLIQDLAAETQARVEMRQIGARDAAAILGGLAPCGRTLCCRDWIKEFDNIHIRMAKTQGLSLNPTSINGMCGRLKCCLRFEHNCYEDLERNLPRKETRVTCPAGSGKVLETKVLLQRVKVALDDQRVLEFDQQDVIVLGSPAINGNNASS